MDNLERLCYNAVNLNLSRYAMITHCSLSGDMVCLVTDDGCLCTYINGKSYCYPITLKSSGSLKYVKYLSLYETIFIASENEILAFDHLLNETVTDFMEKKIIALSWNPVETAFVVINEDYEILLYTFCANLFKLERKIDFNTSVPVSALLEWGSQNTQFQGPKQRKVKANKEEFEVKKVISDGPPNISWRGNGEQFVVNFFRNGCRFIKVFDSFLNPLNESVEYLNLRDPVSFMRQGQYIACCAQQNDKNQLVIFEKNCKLKAAFDLPDTLGEINKLLYHPQMNMLAVHSKSEDERNYIDIYLYSNAKWFLKQQLCYPLGHDIYDFVWIDLHEVLFTTCKLVVLTNQNIEYYTFRFIISRSPLTATVAVTNGSIIDFYMFNASIIPPPMRAIFFKHVRPVNRIIFHSSMMLLILIDSLCQIRCLKFNENCVSSVTLCEQPKDLNISNILSFELDIDELVEEFIDSDKRECCMDMHRENTKLSFQTTNLESTRNTRVFSLPYSDPNLPVPNKILTEELSNLFYLTKHIIDINKSSLEYDFALGTNREFYINDKLVCNGVTSFMIFRGYLIFTHVNSQLYCVRLKDHHLFSDNLNLSKLFARNIEQGARIVACTDVSTPQIILQLPRGNLESIGSKLITIDVIEKMLLENKWQLALHVLREEKVNWNVLIDLNPSRFCDHIEDFIRAAKNCAVLTSIVNDLNLTENCFDTFYKNYLPNTSSVEDFNKHVIVEKILTFLIKTDCINNLNSIVIIQQKHISLKSALKSIKDIFENDPEKNKAICSKAISLILIQDHFKDVLDATFILFDLDFLALVYRTSSEDPKVYEPEIANLNDLNPVTQRFHMCIKGHNLNKAVRYLLRCEHFTDIYITDFVVNNNLEKCAYSTLNKYHRHFNLFTRLYAKRLMITQRYTEAGFILKRAGLLQEALEQYVKALEWREVVCLMNLLEFDNKRKKLLLDKLANSLSKVNRIDEAVILYELHNWDYKKAIQCLVDYKIFRKAFCLAQTYNANDEMENYILPNLKIYMSHLVDKIEGFKNNFEKYANRLKLVRAEKKIKLENTTLECHEDDELFSETGSTISSLGSRATSRSRGSTTSSKNRRKEERKKIDLREGGFYEDIALIRALHILYSEVFCFGEEIRDISLIPLEELSLPTRSIHTKLAKLQSDMLKRLSEIWPKVFSEVSETSDYGDLSIVQNKKDLESKFWSPPTEVLKQSWQLDIFMI